MPSFSVLSTADAFATSEGDFNDTNTAVDVATVPASFTDAQGAFTFEFTAIPQGDTIDSAVMEVDLTLDPVEDVTLRFYMFAAVSPTAPTTNSAI